MFFLFDLLGTWAFAAYGAHKAQKQGFDLFGITTIACLSALGGGTIRDLFLNVSPLYLSEPAYLAAIALGILFTLSPKNWLYQLKSPMLYIDAIGLVTFAYLGAEKAHQFGFSWLGFVFFAGITAVGGSILSDISMRRTPELFYQDFYAVPALLLGFLYFFLHPHINTPFGTVLLLSFIFFLRVLAIHYNIQLWKPKQKIIH